MHELAVTQSVLEIVTRNAQKASAGRVTGVRIVIGQLASIVDDSVQFYWDIISRGTIAEGAVLSFRRIPARFACSECGNDYMPTHEDLRCRHCGSARVRLIAGEEFYVDSIDVQETPSGAEVRGAAEADGRAELRK